MMTFSNPGKQKCTTKTSFSLACSMPRPLLLVLLLGCTGARARPEADECEIKTRPYFPIHIPGFGDDRAFNFSIGPGETALESLLHFCGVYGCNPRVILEDAVAGGLLPQCALDDTLGLYVPAEVVTHRRSKHGKKNRPHHLPSPR